MCVLLPFVSELVIFAPLLLLLLTSIHNVARAGGKEVSGKGVGSKDVANCFEKGLSIISVIFI